jgi:hypothetical protein
MFPLKFCVHNAGRASSFLLSHPILLARTLSFSLIPRTVQFPTEKMSFRSKVQGRAVSWRAASWTVIYLRPQMWVRVVENP